MASSHPNNINSILLQRDCLYTLHGIIVNCVNSDTDAARLPVHFIQYNSKLSILSTVI